ncbi:MAG: dTDP-4-dehydrorhamnose reductase [Paracoccaceae bacterium]|nr:dTDP-4-dehydrorhamnose reductase [Paracoccaceae bacterium]
MKILVLGRSGQLACALQRCCPPDWQMTALGRDQADLTDPAACAAVVAGTKADVVINAAAYTAVDRAETEEDLATTINARAPGAMAQVAAARGLPFVQVSTDYVFDGSGSTPWQTDSPTAPLGAYGRSKLAGERAVRAAGGAAVILRTAWVFSAYGTNFLRTMLHLGATRTDLRVVADQIGGPTPAPDLAKALLHIAASLHARPQTAGTYHFSGSPDVSWADFTRAIMAGAGLDCRISDIPTKDYPTPARRPANSRLECSTLTAAFGLVQPDWRAGLTAALHDLKGP